MVKAIWAVACSVPLAGLLLIPFPGCSSMPARTGGHADLGGTSTSGAGAANSAVTFMSPTVFSGPMYRIGPEDILHVSVWDNKELSLDVVVRPDGKISVPLIQDIQAEGLTAAELADRIHSGLLAYLKEPQVSVVVKQVNAPKFYVIGNIAKPGTYPLRGDMSILQALSLAGGFTEFASRRGIRVVRDIGGRQDVRKVNYFDMIDGGSGNYLLKPGDTIVVP